MQSWLRAAHLAGYRIADVLIPIRVHIRLAVISQMRVSDLS